MPSKTGLNCKAYYNSGTYGSPTWVELTCVRDGRLNFALGEVEAGSRASGVEGFLPTRHQISADLTLVSSDTDTGFIYLWDAFVGRDQIDMLFLNGATNQNGARGVRFDAYLFSANEGQEIDAATFTDTVAKPAADRTNPVKYAVVSSGSPVFTAI